MFWRGWGKSIFISNLRTWSSGWPPNQPSLTKHFNKSWRHTHEKVIHVHHALVLPDSNYWTGSSISLQNPPEQRSIIWPDPALPALAYSDDAIHGARSFL